MSSVLCFTPPFLCANPELSKDDEKELPKNVVDPLYPSSPLSVLEPNNLSQYDTETYTLSQYETETSTLSHYESEPYNLSLHESKPNALSHYESEIKNLPLYEILSKSLSLHEIKPKDLSLHKIKPKDLSLYEIKPKDLPLSESKSKSLPQNELVASCLPLSAYLSLLTNGTGGAWTGHSTDGPRSLPPTLQPGIWEVVKTACLSGWSTLMKNTLSGTKYMMKKMAETFRPAERGIFKHLPPECQKSRNNKVFPMDKDECGKNALVEKRDCACASLLWPVNCTSSCEGPLVCGCVHPSRKLFNSQKTTDLIECFGQVKMSLK